jgi:hypothetical protein
MSDFAFRTFGKLPSVMRWQLELDKEVIARIDVDEFDFPFTYGQLVDSPLFERFRRYFSDPDQSP